MAKIKYTPQQEKVLEDKSSNLLVSASAGSGKTATVIQKIFNLIKFRSMTNKKDADGKLLSGTEYNIPDKECIAAREDDPCTLFNAISFPVNEFSPYIPHGFGCGCSVPPPKKDRDNSGCGCK